MLVVASHNAKFYDDHVIMSSIACNGSEKSISDCIHDDYVTSVNCSAVAAALCEGQKHINIIYRGKGYGQSQ